MKSSFIYELSEFVTYAQDGQQLETMEVEVVAPSKSMHRKTYFLQQIVAQAILTVQTTYKQESEPGDESAEMEAKDMKMFLLAGGADLAACIDQASKLAKDGCVKVAGNPINFLQWDKLDPIDQELITCGFIANFILPLVGN